MSFEKLRSETIYRGKVFNIRIDDVLLPDGGRTQIDIVEHAGAVVMVPIDSEDQVCFVTQYRHPVEQDLLELPAGVMDPGETAVASAIRELREEIGMTAGKIVPLGSFFLAPGYSSELIQVFLAQDLVPAPLSADEGEFIEVVKVPVSQILAYITSGKVRDAKSLAAILLWQNIP